MPTLLYPLGRASRAIVPSAWCLQGPWPPPSFHCFPGNNALEAQMSIGALPADDYTSSAGPVSEAAGELSASPGLSVMLWSATRRPPD